MSLPAGMPPGCVSPGVAGRALAGLAAAVQAAERADHTVAALENSVQPQTLDFRTLGLNDWNRWAALAMLKGRDGVVRFTDGDTPASRRQSDGGIDIAVRATARGGTVTVQAETLLGNSDGVLPAILCFGDRAGELVPTLRVR
eukprot:2590281-Pleurochrysis_carterae.AAC.1